MKVVSAGEFAARSRCEAPAQWLDVRSSTEYAAGHIPGAINIPLEEIEARLEDISADLPLVLVCKGGQRARMAAGLLEPCRQKLSALDGGTDAWLKAGLPLVISKKTRWSLERQVRLVAGTLVLGATIAAALTSRAWLLATGFVGLGLTLAGLTDLCPMAVVLSAMPWNRTRKCDPGTAKEGKCCV
jgi:rhodanese-related sulfurtransferase